MEHCETAHSDKYLSISEAASLYNVTRQAIYVAIKQKKLQAVKRARWEISVRELEAYQKNKYSRERSLFNGELLFNNDQGYYSISQVAKMLNVPSQKIYYAAREGILKSLRKGVAWVLHIDDVKQYQENYLDRRRKREVV